MAGTSRRAPRGSSDLSATAGGRRLVL